MTSLDMRSATATVSRRAMLVGASVAVFAPSLTRAAEPNPRLAAFIASDQRSAGNTARDIWRKPAEVLSFFGVEPQHTVVEVLPGSTGYWTEILAPYLKEDGRYIAAGRDEEASVSYLEDHARMLAKYAASPDRFGRIVVTRFNADKHEIAPPGSADFVLTFRNLHNWLDRHEIDGALRAFHRALKPGGVLGVADHRGRTDMSQEEQMRSGYVREDFATALIEKAGFKLVDTSQVKANPKDTKDHADGVWSLPPTYRSGDKDREKYAAIGESDRFVLKFWKM